MALVTPDVGEVKLLTDLLAGATTENWTLKLYSACATSGGVPTDASILSDFTEATFTGYSSKTLTRTVSGTTWNTPTTSAGVTSSQYGSAAQSWSPTSSQTILGYYVVGATSGVLIYAEAFASSRALVSGDTLNVTPKIALD